MDMIVIISAILIGHHQSTDKSNFMSLHPDTMHQIQTFLFPHEQRKVFRCLNNECLEVYDKQQQIEWNGWQRINEMIQSIDWNPYKALNESDRHELDEYIQTYRFCRCYIVNIPTILQQISQRIVVSERRQFEEFCQLLLYPMKLMNHPKKSRMVATENYNFDIIAGWFGALECVKNQNLSNPIEAKRFTLHAIWSRTL